MTKPDKSKLLKELEKVLSPEDYCYENKHKSAFTIDVMSNIRRLKTTGHSTFLDMISVFYSSIRKYMEVGRSNFVFDVYHDKPSVKDCERLRRQQKVPINLSEIDFSTPLPKEMDSFWPSSSNKLLLEKLLYKSLCAKESNFPIVIGQLVPNDEKWQCLIRQDTSNIIPHMTSQPYLEEADLQIILHVLNSIESGFVVNVVLSNDTDVVVALLYYMSLFRKKGLQELWLRGGVGDTTRFIPIHTLSGKLGENLCSVLPAVHSLTGCDITSKIGTKRSALVTKPVKYLGTFGTKDSLSNKEIKEAEEYLVNVLKRDTKSKNFTQLRSELFDFSNTASHLNLPPTTDALLPHIKRAFYNTYSLTHITDEKPAEMNPELFGFEMKDNLLLPEKHLLELSDLWTVKCKCTNCSRTTCPCRMKSTKCVRFCGCKKKDDCKNTFNT